MITVYQYRNRGTGPSLLQAPAFENSYEAAAHVMRTELAWNATVVELMPGHIELQLDVFGFRDETVIDGPSDEMAFLVRLVFHYHETGEHESVIRDTAADSMMAASGGVPLHLTMVAPAMVGASRLRAALMMACEITDPREIRLGMQLDTDDMIAAFEFTLECGCDLGYAFELAS